MLRRISCKTIFPPSRVSIFFSGIGRNCSTKTAKAARISKKLSEAPIPDKQAHTTAFKLGYGSVGLLLTLGLSSFVYYDLNKNPEGFVASLYNDSQLQKFISRMLGSVSEIYKPESEKLLPDWGSLPFYAGLMPGTPPMPLLVLDLERTLIGSVHDTKYGWRHAKRPGVEKLLQALSQYYEIVIFSENDIASVEEILLAIDPDHRCHYLGATHGELRDTVIVKRLDFMNRDVRRIILVDDDPQSFQDFPRNTIKIKPYVNIYDKNDTILLDLIPVLQAFVHDNVEDFTKVLDNLGTHDADEVVTEYHMRVSRKRAEELQKRNKGLGGLLRGKGANSTETLSDMQSNKSSILSISDIVGAAPVTNGFVAKTKPINNSNSDVVPSVGYTPPSSDKVVKKTGWLFGAMQQVEKDKQEANEIKIQKMNEIYQKKMRDKAAAREQEQSAKQNNNI